MRKINFFDGDSFVFIESVRVLCINKRFFRRSDFAAEVIRVIDDKYVISIVGLKKIKAEISYLCPNAMKISD